jgi:hypothetical protein
LRGMSSSGSSASEDNEASRGKPASRKHDSSQKI